MNRSELKRDDVRGDLQSPPTYPIYRVSVRSVTYNNAEVINSAFRWDGSAERLAYHVHRAIVNGWTGLPSDGEINVSVRRG